jgi:hypothetical protein
LATDRQDNPIVLLLAYQLYRPTGKEAYGTDVYYEDKADFTSGRLTVLVPPTDVTSEEGIRILLEDICGIQARSEPPSWVQQVAMPGDADLDARIGDATAELRQREGVLKDVEQEKEQRESFKAILYEDGFPLQEACRNTFEAMGLKTVPSPVSDEFMLEHEGQLALVEVTGSRRGVALRKVSQLNKDISEYFAQRQETIRGVFVGNPWRMRPPEQRETNDTPTFPNNVVTFAVGQHMALLSTVELFNAYCAYLEGRLDTSGLFTWLMEGEGVITADDAPSPGRARPAA